MEPQAHSFHSSLSSDCELHTAMNHVITALEQQILTGYVL